MNIKFSEPTTSTSSLTSLAGTSSLKVSSSKLTPSRSYPASLRDSKDVALGEITVAVETEREVKWRGDLSPGLSSLVVTTVR